MRKPKGNDKLSQYNTKTTDAEVRKVSSARCYSKHYCQTFPQALTLIVRQIFYLKSFEEKRDDGIATGGQMHSVDGDRRRKYLTLHGEEVLDVALCGSLGDCVVPYSWHSEVHFSQLCAKI